MSDARAALILDDGATFPGKPFGASGEAIGRTVFYTGVVGYQEVLTNPSYRGTVLVLTYPIIGVYGINAEDDESPAAHARGLVVREYSPYYSNFRATGGLEDFLKKHGVVGIREVDTRAVAVHLRDHGERRGAIVSGDIDPGKAAATLNQRPPREDLVEESTWEEERRPRGRTRCRLVVLNLGATRGLLDQLTGLGCRLDVLRASATAEDVLQKRPQGVLLVGGPGDPRTAKHAVETAKALLGKVPLLGIGLGHQVLGLALGCRIRRLKTGHHGLNYPVKNVQDGTAAITVQHHSCVIDDRRLPRGVEVTHRNLNDRTVEGLRSRKVPAWGIQFHPTPDERDRPNPILTRFCHALAKP
jgi:carbamoyl-phosphate synthase small subunit